MPNIVQGNVSALRNRLTARNRKGYVLQVRERTRQLGIHQMRINRIIRHIAERLHRQLLARGIVRNNTQRSWLCKSSCRASIGPEAEPERLQVERRDGAAAHDLCVRVQSQLTKLQKVDWAGGAGVLGRGVWEHAGYAGDGALCWC